MSYQKIKNVVYNENKDEVLTCDIYLPNSNLEDYPVVAFYHGGSFHTGSKEMYEEWGAYLSSNDIVVFSFNYTLATPTKPSYDYLLDDLKASINFIVKCSNEYSLDPYNIAVAGDSAGGYLACLAALKLTGSSYKIKSCIPVYGVYDLLEWSNYTDTTRSDVVVKKLLGTTPELKREIFEQGSIFRMIEQAKQDPHFKTNFYVIYGEQDDVVLAQHQSKIFIDLLKQYDIDHEVLAIEDCGHFWFTPINENKLLELHPTNVVSKAVLEYLKETLKHTNTYDNYLYEV